MGKVVLFVSEREFEHFMMGNAFEGKTCRQYTNEIEVHVPSIAIKEYKKLFRGFLTVFVHEKRDW